MLTQQSIVFLHGLGGDSRATWRAQDSQQPWPQQLLPPKLPLARIMSYGYDSHIAHLTHLVSRNTVGDHANNLLRDLSNHRDDDNTVCYSSSSHRLLTARLTSLKNERPLIFVAHILGGLVCEDVSPLISFIP
jgi:protein SERAC1